jgi:hypothetical protein
MLRGPKRHAQAALGEPWDVTRLRALNQLQRHAALPAERGLAAIHVRLPPSTSWPVERITQSVGQFIFVLSGSAGFEGNELQPWESAFVSSTEVDVSVTAGPDGAEIVALHMPNTEPEYLMAQDAQKFH